MQLAVLSGALRARVVFLLLCSMFLVVVSAHSSAGEVKLAWDAVANATGYKIHYGQASRSYSANVDVRNVTTYTVPALVDGARYYFAVTAYGSTGTTESGYSNEVNALASSTTTAAPAASFSASPTSGAAPLVVTLTDTSTGSITGRSWNLGDGTTATTQTVSKTYSNPGTYTVILTVTGAGGSTTASRTISVGSTAPTAAFTATPLTGAAPLTVNFSNTSSGTYSSSSWQFGDGTSSTAASPAKTYSSPGTYTVSLTVSGTAGSNTATKTGYINVTAPSGTTSSTTVVTPGLVAAYGFEEATGTQVIDASGNGNHGSVSGALRASTNRFGKALQFDGVNDWITINDSASLDLTGGMTIQAWVYPTATTGWRTVLIKEQTGGGLYELFSNTDSGRPDFALYIGGAYRELLAGSTLPANTWTHLAATYNGATQSLYVNGTLVGSRPQSGTVPTSSGPLRIGGNSIWGEYFQGYIDEVRLYNRALSQAEIAADSKRAVVGLTMSTSATRSNPAPLNGAAVTGNVYVSYALLSPTASTNPARQVVFWLDDANPSNPTGTPYRTADAAPFDLAGTASDGTALALNTATLVKGIHTVSARVTLTDGTVLPVIVGKFTVQ